MTSIDTVKAAIIRAQTSANYDGTDDIVAALMPLIQEAQANAWEQGYDAGCDDSETAYYRDEAP